ncbi:MAG: flagellar hook-basal body complex protein FliE [Lachnospiraceae bacterium]|nr:flagellar hook-basal body complex protein FliE [Lachnospiraceae bacterium]
MGIEALTNVTSEYIKAAANAPTKLEQKNEDFGAVFKAAQNMINDANDLETAAKSEEIKFALGYSENTHDLAAAMTKANLALQFTVAVRDKAMDAYKEIMNMQI